MNRDKEAGNLAKLQQAVASLINNVLPKNGFARNVGVLTGGTVAAQSILILASPLLTRMYTPADFGLLAVYASLLGSITVISGLRYELAIPLPAEDQDAANILALSLLIVLAVAILSTLPVLFFKEQIAQLLKIPEFATYLWLLPIGVLLAGTYQVLNYWAVRSKVFKVIARTKLTQSIAAIAIQVGGYTFGPLALLLGQISGQTAGSTSLAVRTLSKRQELLKGVSFAGMCTMAIRYRRFPIYDAWAGLCNVVGWQLPALLIAAFFGPAIAGAYALANRVLAMPAALVGQSISQVFFSSAAEARRNGSLAQTVRKVQAVLTRLILPFILILFVAGPDLFAIIFGDQWRIAGELSKWLSVMLYVQFVVSPLSVLFFVFEKQNLNLLMQLLLLVVRVSGLFIGAHANDITLAVKLYSIGSAVCYGIFLNWINRAAGCAWSDNWRPTLAALPVSVIPAIPLLIVITMTPHKPVPVLATLAGSIVIASIIFVRSFSSMGKLAEQK